jgi:hypothetical protein
MIDTPLIAHHLYLAFTKDACYTIDMTVKTNTKWKEVKLIVCPTTKQ